MLLKPAMRCPSHDIASISQTVNISYTSWFISLTIHDIYTIWQFLPCFLQTYSVLKGLHVQLVQNCIDGWCLGSNRKSSWQIAYLISSHCLKGLLNLLHHKHDETCHKFVFIWHVYLSTCSSRMRQTRVNEKTITLYLINSSCVCL